jgi:nicotinamidase-related amidase
VPTVLATLVEPAITALLAVELKRVTVGDLQASSPDGAPGNPLGAVAAEQRLLPRLAALADSARAAGVRPDDLVSVRLHGVAPFVGTGLDPMLRNLGIRTVVLVGGSVNVGIVGAAIEAVDLGYRVVIPRDGVIGHPTEYAELVLEHTLALLARLTTVDDLRDVWRAALRS